MVVYPFNASTPALSGAGCWRCAEAL